MLLRLTGAVAIDYSFTMYQIYFLSILTNIVAGIALGFDRMDKGLRLRSAFNADLFQHTGFRLALGLITFAVGFLKLLSVTSGDVAVVGDLVPALTGLLMGFGLAFQYYRERAQVTSTVVESLDRVFGRNTAVLGTIGVIAGVVHFFLPRVLFL